MSRPHLVNLAPRLSSGQRSCLECGAVTVFRCGTCHVEHGKTVPMCSALECIFAHDDQYHHLFSDTNETTNERATT